MEKETYTIEEVVEITIGILAGISIPVELSESVGVPVARGIGNLKALKRKFEQDRIEAGKGAEDGRNVDAE